MSLVPECAFIHPTGHQWILLYSLSLNGHHPMKMREKQTNKQKKRMRSTNGKINGHKMEHLLMAYKTIKTWIVLIVANLVKGHSDLIFLFF